MAQIDGEFSNKERVFYKAMLSRMSFDEHTQAEFKKLMANEGNIIEAISQIEDDEIKYSLVEVLVLMAVYDGELVKEERDFLIKTAAHLNVPLNIDEVELQADDYKAIVEKNIFQKAAGSTKETASKAAIIAKGSAATARGKVTIAFGNAFRRRKDEVSNGETDGTVVICTNCKNEVSAGHKFCPACGQSTATEKKCVSCDEILPIDFSFCPHCGATQDK
jgi:RNA polymerase subunit RPABC4/transcription elongation factor Spt4